jgi:hypothetical protein
MSDFGTILERHGARDQKLTVTTFTASEDGESEDIPGVPEEFVLLQGDSDSLRFLGQVILAMADGELGGSFFLHPNGAGSAHFSTSSTVGIYLLKKSCSLSKLSFYEAP